MTAESLFAECIIPGCTQPVTDELTPCQTCRTIFGPMLQEADRPPSYTAADLAERDAGTAAAYRMMRALPTAAQRNDLDTERERRTAEHEKAAAQERGEAEKASQTCWLCEERRTCLLRPPRVGMPTVPRDPLTHGPSRTPLTAPARAAAISATPLRSAAAERPAENRTRRSGCAAQTPPPTTSRRESQRPPVHEPHR